MLTDKLPLFLTCPKCLTLLFFPIFTNDNYYYYCKYCSLFTKWTYFSIISKSQLSFNLFEKILFCYIQNKGLKDTLDYMKTHFKDNTFNKNTINHYFQVFNKITIKYYEEKLNTIMFDGSVEIDESFLYRIKRTKAIRKRYNSKSCWLFGIIQRETREFVIIPVLTRDEETLIPLILKYVQIGATIYSDCFSTYLKNNVFPKESKLIQYGYHHQWINHKVEFVSSYFSHVHTNTIERLWLTIKTDFRKKNIKKISYTHIARFYFHHTLTEDEQLDILMKEILRE